MSELATILPINAAFEDLVVRMAVLDGEAFWACKDACEAMGITKYRNAMSQLDPDERTEHLVQTAGGPQLMVFVNEPGLWSLMLISRSPKVKLFKRWITHEVLPAIRETGSYSVKPSLPQTLPEALRAYADEVEARELAQARVAELEPKGEAYDEFIDSRSALSMKLAGEYLGWGRNQLLSRLREEGVLRTGGANHNLPYAQYDRHFQVVPWTQEVQDGKVLHAAQTLIWPESLDWIRRRVGMGPRKPRPREG